MPISFVRTSACLADFRQHLLKLWFGVGPLQQHEPERQQSVITFLSSMNAIRGERSSELK
jgi:hypothetical protein